MQETCIRCNKKLGFLDKWKCKDGVFCYDCIKNLHKTIRNDLKMYSVNQITSMIEHPEQYSGQDGVPQKFKFANRTVTFDSVNQKFFVETAGFFRSKLIPYSSIVSYEYKEDGKTKGTYGKIVGAAALGGILFGGAGAIVGAQTQGKGEKYLVKRIEIEIHYNQNGQPEIFHMTVLDPVLHTEAVESGSFEYKQLIENAQKAMWILDEIIQKNYPETVVQEQSVQAQSLSAADEIRKFKGLMDEGIITKDEFEMKKKDLLG